MISLPVVKNIHDLLIEKFGGLKGIRDLPGLEAALARPYGSFGSIDLYPTPEDKAAAIFESILMNHPFVDGNKRTAYVLLRLILMDAGYDIKASQAEKYQMVIDSSKGIMRYDEIKQWVKARMIKK